MVPSLRVLVIEDRPDDALLVIRELRRGGYDCSYQRVETASEMAAALAGAPWDAVLADYRLPAFSATGALHVLKESGLDLPFIIVSGTIDEESAVEALRAGAHDFVTKARLARLVPAVERELREAANRRERALAQERLAELQGTLASFYRAAPVLMGVVELLGEDDILHVFDNPATEQFFGVGYTEGRRASEIGVPPEVRQVWVRHYRDSLRSGEPQRFEYWHPSREAGRCLRVTVAPIAGEESDGDRFCYVAEDITLSKSFDEEVGRRERRFRSLIENASDVVSVLDREGRLIFGSPSMTQILGYSPAERLGRPVFEQIHHDDRTAVRATLERALASPGKHSGKVTARYRHRDGSWRVLEAVGTNLLDDESVRGIVVNVRDITETAAAEAALRESEDRYRTLVEILPVGVVVTNASGALVTANQAAARIWGMDVLRPDPHGDLPGFTAAWALDGRPLKAEECTVARALRGEELSSPDEMRVVGLDGVERTILAHSVPLRGPADEVTGVVVSIIDITDAKSMQDQLRQSQKMEAVGRLAGGMAHDFNNVLTAIRGHASFLAESLAHEKSLTEDVDEILRSTERAASLTRQLLAFSRRQVLAPVLMDMRDAVLGMRGMLQRLLGEDVVLEIRSADEPCVVHADPGQIEQVILNLALNARDAMPDGGQLILGTERRRDPAEEGAGSVVLTVADQGCGIPPEVLPHIFEPFFTTKPSGKGTGLGLSTVYGIVEQAGGDVTVLSTPAEGTTFTVVLPGKDAAPDARSPHGSAAAEATGSETILLVEDEDAVRSLVRRSLERRGFRVIEACSGGEALLAVERLRGAVDLVVTDVVMPHLTGPDLVNRIREHWPATRVLFMSGYTEDEVFRRGVASTGVTFLQKPFSPDELVRSVRDALDAVMAP